MTSRDPQRCCEAVWLAILATAWLLVLRQSSQTMKHCNICLVSCRCHTTPLFFSLEMGIFCQLSKEYFSPSLFSERKPNAAAMQPFGSLWQQQSLIYLYNNNNNNTLIYIAPACRMTSEALADSSSRATECLTEK